MQEFFTYIHDAIIAVLSDNMQDMTRFTVGAVLIFILVACLAYLVGYTCRKNQKKRIRK